MPFSVHGNTQLSGGTSVMSCGLPVALVLSWKQTPEREIGNPFRICAKGLRVPYVTVFKSKLICIYPFAGIRQLLYKILILSVWKCSCGTHLLMELCSHGNQFFSSDSALCLFTDARRRVLVKRWNGRNLCSAFLLPLSVTEVPRRRPGINLGRRKRGKERNERVDLFYGGGVK